MLFPVKGSDLSALNTATDVIRNRVDGLGIAEPDVQRQGNTIVVNLPGVKDRAKAESLVGETAELRFRQVIEQNGSPVVLPFTAQVPATLRPPATGARRPPAGRPRARPPACRRGSASTTTKGQAAGPPERTISTLPIVNRTAADTPSTTSPNLTPTTAGSTTTTSPAKAGQNCAELIKQNPVNLDTAQQVWLPDRDHQNCCCSGR